MFEDEIVLLHELLIGSGVYIRMALRPVSTWGVANTPTGTVEGIKVTSIIGSIFDHIGIGHSQDAVAPIQRTLIGPVWPPYAVTDAAKIGVKEATRQRFITLNSPGLHKKFPPLTFGL